MSSQNSANPSSRPIAGFQPCDSGHHFLNIHHHDEETHNQKEQEIYQIKQEVGVVLARAKEPQELLKLIDTLERLGVAYHFEKEIEEALENTHESFHAQCEDADLNHVSLCFRIYRQHGFCVPCDVFDKFKDVSGKFKESLRNVVEGMLSLFEASHVGVHDDKILDESLAFTTTYLEETIAANNLLSPPFDEQVAHALHQPLHKGIPRVEARFYISIYEKHLSHDKLLLQFAKLDFNFLQSMHQKELKDLTRWWKGLHSNASFSRDRMTEAYFWIIGLYFEPQFSVARKLLAKVVMSTTLMDDTYDAYGTLEELKMLTEAFQRPWDKCVMDELPKHVKWCYYAFVETCEEVEEEVNKEGRSFCTDYLRQQVKVLTRKYMQETKWCHEKYVPTYEEYMKNAIITSPSPLGIISSFLGLGETASMEHFEWASQSPMPNVIKAASTILRLMNDVGGHQFEQSRNHIASAVQCLMKHNNVSEKEANEILKKKVEDAWKDVNQAMLRPYLVPKLLLSRILNSARSANVIYHGANDGFTQVNKILKSKVDLVLARHISM